MLCKQLVKSAKIAWITDTEQYVEIEGKVAQHSKKERCLKGRNKPFLTKAEIPGFI